MTEPRVEAGDRALETAKEIRGMFGDGDNCAICKATVAKIAALIQSAMNAQEREWKEVLRQCASMLEAIRWGAFCDAPSNLELRIERLLAERGGTV